MRPFVPMRAVAPEGGGLVAPETRRYGEVKKGYTSFLTGDVIMAKITPCMENGKTTVVPDVPGAVCFGSTEFHVARAETGISPRWIAAFLVQHDVRRAAQRAMTGGVGQMRVPESFLETLRLPIAPTAEQDRVADALDELFSDLDAGVAALVRVREQLKHYRASVLKAAVEGALTAEWRVKHPKTEPATELLARILVDRRHRWEEDQLAKFKKAGKTPPKNWKAKYQEPASPAKTGLPPIPAGWCWATLDQLSLTAGYGTSVKCREDSSGLAVLRIPNIVSGKLDLGDLKYAPVGYEEPDEELIRTGDMLVVRTNGSRLLIGRAAVVDATPSISLSFASYLIRFRLPTHPDLLRWISHLWMSSYVRQWVETNAATSAGQHNISLGKLATLCLPVPPQGEQPIIGDLVEDQLSVIDHLEADIDAKLKESQSLRQSILRHAFTGKLVAQNPKDEPASELLKRIAADREERARQVRPARMDRSGRPKKAKKS